MKIFETVKALRDYLDAGTKPSSIGFVPTMGALHEGHLALIRKSMEDNELSVCSIFVNPTQFNKAEDLVNYPRTVESDIIKLEKTGCDLLFLPSVKEVYPEYPPNPITLDLGPMLQVMEGKERPGHFTGVMTVVKRLFEIVKPDRSYFGEKDFQQLRVITAMVEALGMDIEVIPFPTVREEGGLAMSSRNVRLSAEEKELALNIPKALFGLKDEVRRFPVRMNEIRKEVYDRLSLISGGKVEYLEIVNEIDLQQEDAWTDKYPLRACLALYIGKIRLIDNIRL